MTANEATKKYHKIKEVDLDKLNNLPLFRIYFKYVVDFLYIKEYNIINNFNVQKY